MKISKKVTLKRIMRAIESERDCFPGFCTACGASAEGVEPDACRYECESCGEPAVYGAEELLLMVA